MRSNLCLKTATGLKYIGFDYNNIDTYICINSNINEGISIYELLGKDLYYPQISLKEKITNRLSKILLSPYNRDITNCKIIKKNEEIPILNEEGIILYIDKTTNKVNFSKEGFYCSTNAIEPTEKFCDPKHIEQIENYFKKEKTYTETLYGIPSIFRKYGLDSFYEEELLNYFNNDLELDERNKKDLTRIGGLNGLCSLEECKTRNLQIKDYAYLSTIIKKIGEKALTIIKKSCN